MSVNAKQQCRAIVMLVIFFVLYVALAGRFLAS